jgi:hypothetical protein
MSRGMDQTQRLIEGASGVKQISDPDACPLAGLTLSEFVITPWASEQLRDRIHRNNAALAAELQDRDRLRHSRRAGPEAEPEAEP